MNSEHTVLHGAHKKKKLKTYFKKELKIAQLRQTNIDRDYPPNGAKQDEEEEVGHHPAKKNTHQQNHLKCVQQRTPISEQGSAKNLQRDVRQIILYHNV